MNFSVDSVKDQFKDFPDCLRYFIGDSPIYIEETLKDAQPTPERWLSFREPQDAISLYDR